jgi:hypothetical protein
MVAMDQGKEEAGMGGNTWQRISGLTNRSFDHFADNSTTFFINLLLNKLAETHAKSVLTGVCT